MSQETKYERDGTLLPLVSECWDRWREAAQAWEQLAMKFMAQRDAAIAERDAARAELKKKEEGK